jgi:Family of unknown function (DUF6521)
MSTPIWSDRSVEQARLLNPAFLAALLWSCSEGYSSVTERGIPGVAELMYDVAIENKIEKNNEQRIKANRMS